MKGITNYDLVTDVETFPRWSKNFLGRASPIYAHKVPRLMYFC